MNLVNYHGQNQPQLINTGYSYLAGANPNTPNLIPYGLHYIPLKDMKYHVLALGSTGTGKSLTLKNTLAHQLAYCTKGSGFKVVIFDAKGDLLPIANYFSHKNGVPLYQINISDNRSIQPMDGVKGYAWDICKDCEGSKGRLFEMLSILFPAPKDEKDPFWGNTLRLLSLAAVENGGHWGLYDIYNLFFSPNESIDKILDRSEIGKTIKERILRSKADKTRDSILINGIASVFSFSLAAAHQYYTPKERWLSMKEFIQGGEGILVIGQDLAARSASNPITQAMFKTLVNQINTLPDIKDSDPPRISFYIEEAPFLGELSGLIEGLTFQRSKGAYFYIVAQDIEGLKKVYGQDGINSIANNCDFKFFYRTNSSETAEWCVAQGGKERFYEDSTSFNQGQNGIWTQNINRNLVEKNVFVSGDFLNLLPVNKKNGVYFYFFSPHTPKYTKYCLSFQEINDLKPQIIPCNFIPKKEKYTHMPSIADQQAIERYRQTSQGKDKIKSNPAYLEKYLTNHPMSRAIRTQVLEMLNHEYGSAILSILNFAQLP
jgi:Type IV secretion-system coupling protein DNA-binding domain